MSNDDLKYTPLPWLSPWIDVNSDFIFERVKNLAICAKATQKVIAASFDKDVDAWFDEMLNEPTQKIKKPTTVAEYLGPQCECGGDKLKTTHSVWCPKFQQYK